MTLGTTILAIVWAFFLILGFVVGFNEIWIFGAILLAATIAIGIDRYNTSKK